MPTFSDQVGPLYPKGKNQFTPEGKPICNYCHYSNHITRNCQELAYRNQRRNNNGNGGHNNYQSQSNSSGQFIRSQDSRNFQVPHNARRVQGNSVFEPQNVTNIPSGQEAVTLSEN